MSHIYRCNRCRTRNTFRRALATYVRPKRCRHCAHDRFYVDKERVRRRPCHCSGYHFAHRPGSRCCEHHPLHPFYRSGDEDVLFDLMLQGKGKSLGNSPVPF